MERAQKTLMAVAVVLALAIWAAIGGETRDIEEHGRWLSELRDGGAWMIW